MQKLFITDDAVKSKKFDTQDFLQKNKRMIRLWTYMGTSMPITLLIIAAIFNIIFFYFYALVFALNAYAVIMLVMQVKIDKNTMLKKTDGEN